MYRTTAAGVLVFLLCPVGKTIRP